MTNLKQKELHKINGGGIGTAIMIAAAVVYLASEAYDAYRGYKDASEGKNDY